MTSVAELRNDLVAEQNSLDDVVSDLSLEQWSQATASAGWNVFDQVAHLAYFDERASVAISDPDQFGRDLQELLERAAYQSVDDITVTPLRSLSPKALLARWRMARSTLTVSADALDDDSRVAWYGPSMSARSFLTARLMETWAHGFDVVEALDAQREATDRLRHVARLGLLTRGWSYSVRGETAPAGAIRLELIGPGGETWHFGPDEADDVVEGLAEEFCLVVTQRRHVNDTALEAGELGMHWLTRAQAFVGAPSEGPRPRSRQ
ncbi:MAG: TIGR03084 family metal-binding protein [Acidimicrobiales bacterium]